LLRSDWRGRKQQVENPERYARIAVEKKLQTMIDLDFEQLGLTENEGKIYIALLELGGGYVSSIARRTKIQRVNCYYIIEKLTEKGLITNITKGRARFYSAEPPQVIANIMEGKTNYIKSKMPELLSITNTLAFKPKIKYFEGMEGLKKILEDTLTAKKEILGYSNLKAFGELFRDYIQNYTNEKMKRAIKTRMICPASKEAFAYKKKYYPKNIPSDLVEFLFVNRKEFWFEHEITIYDNKVAVISLNKEELVGMIFESRMYAQSQTAIFNMAWLGASHFVAL